MFSLNQTTTHRNGIDGQQCAVEINFIWIFSPMSRFATFSINEHSTTHHSAFCQTFELECRSFYCSNSGAGAQCPVASYVRPNAWAELAVAKQPPTSDALWIWNSTCYRNQSKSGGAANMCSLRSGQAIDRSKPKWLSVERVVLMDSIVGVVLGTKRE